MGSAGVPNEVTVARKGLEENTRMVEDSAMSRNLKTSHGARRPETSAGGQPRMSTAARPDTTVGMARSTYIKKQINPLDRTIIFAMSPRTYDQTLKGAPKEFLGAQEFNMGTYDRSTFGRSVPGGWDKQPEISSRAALMAKRRSNMIPDATFDLDGDGCVSKEDYTISLRNDKNKDGRLDTAERKAAMAEVHANRPSAKFAALRPITAPEFVRLDSTGFPKEALPTRTQLLETRRKDMVTKNHKVSSIFHTTLSTPPAPPLLTHTLTQTHAHTYTHTHTHTHAHAHTHTHARTHTRARTDTHTNTHTQTHTHTHTRTRTHTNTHAQTQTHTHTTHKIALAQPTSPLPHPPLRRGTSSTRRLCQK